MTSLAIIFGSDSSIPYQPSSGKKFLDQIYTTTLYHLMMSTYGEMSQETMRWLLLVAAVGRRTPDLQKQ